MTGVRYAPIAHRSIRNLVRTKHFRATADKCATVDVDKFYAAAAVIGQRGSVRAALRSHDVHESVKVVLRQMEIAESRVPGTDGALFAIADSVG